MSKVQYLEKIVEEFGPHLHDAPFDGWLADRVIDKVVPTHCPYCGVQCGLNLLVEKNHVVGFEPRYDFPVNEGRLCPKGVTAYLQVHHPDRLLYPLIKRNGSFERASWDEALELVVSKFKQLQTEHGKDSIGVYSGSSLTTEKTYLMGKFARAGLGTRYVDYNGRLCMVSAAAGNNKAFGIDRAANPWSDIPLAEVLLIAGANCAETFPVLNKYLWDQRDNGGRWIVIDPRETATARQGDLHLQLKPGTDVALANGMLHVLIQEELIDQSFIDARTNDWETTREVVTRYTPDVASQISGVPAEKIIQAARLYGRAKTAMVMHARGIEHHSNGVNNVLSYINLVLATGKIGAPGRGYGTITGQGNGQGGREHGQKADQLPGQRSINNPEHRKHVCQVWDLPEAELPQAGVSVVEMFDKMREREIRGLLSICNNVMVSLPDTNKVRQSLEGLDFYVCIDFFMSEGARYADVVLPGSAWSEDEGVTCNSEGRVVKINKANDSPGEARADWWIVQEIGRRMGRAKYFTFNSPREIFDELRIASRGGNADYYGITWEKIERQNGVFWPCPTEDHPGTPRLFEERFYHPDGKAKFHAIEYNPPNEVPDDEFPLILTSGRVVYQYLSGNQTRRIGFLVEQCPEPYVEIHPETAMKLKVNDGERVRVVSRRGEGVFPALVVRTIRPDTIFIPYHWGEELAVNQLTNPKLDPTSKIPEYKACAARIEKIHSRQLPIMGQQRKGASLSEVR
ncbi:MAG TPA: formate dehydrogenase subunit alpha [Pyrinomonadaceae bacterium]|jgi:assimilatory nitrate reductase catalytic subunit|nr:formate dehydrogenase subunit alpha [Pyrinomonadaceae bacterium]